MTLGQIYEHIDGENCVMELKLFHRIESPPITVNWVMPKRALQLERADFDERYLVPAMSAIRFHAAAPRRAPTDPIW